MTWEADSSLRTDRQPLIGALTGLSFPSSLSSTVGLSSPIQGGWKGALTCAPGGTPSSRPLPSSLPPGQAGPRVQSWAPAPLDLLAIYTVEYACSAVKNLVDSSVYFRSVEGLLKQAISIRDHMNATTQGHR